MPQGKRCNALLAGKLKEHGFTQAELARQVNQHCARLTGTPGAATDRYIRNLLDGTIDWPHARYRHALEAIFTCTALDLGFIPRGRDSLRPSPQRPAGRPGQQGRRPPLQRRDFLRLSGGATIALFLPDLPQQGRITMSDVEHMRAYLDGLHPLDQQYGGGAVADLAIRQTRRVQAALQTAVASDRVERALYSLAGEYAAAAGWYALDAGDLTASRSHTDQGLRAATIARDPMLQANLWNLMILQARTGKNHGEGLSIARSALAAFSPRDPAVKALFHMRAAMGHAAYGERGQAERSTGRAADALARAGEGERPSWLKFLDEAELSGLEACDRLTLGLYRAAEARAREALVVLPVDHSRNRTFYTVTLAEAQLGARDVDAACAAGTHALDLAAHLKSGRVLTRLDRFAARLAAWDTPSVRDWQDRFAQVRAVVA